MASPRTEKSSFLGVRKWPLVVKTSMNLSKWTTMPVLINFALRLTSEVLVYKASNKCSVAIYNLYLCNICTSISTEISRHSRAILLEQQTFWRVETFIHKQMHFHMYDFFSHERNKIAPSEYQPDSAKTLKKANKDSSHTFIICTTSCTCIGE